MESFAPGKVIFLQGEKYQHYYILQSGSVEILCADREFDGLDAKLILSHSRRVGVIAEKTFIVPFSGKTIRATSDSKLQKFSLPAGGFADLVSADPANAINFLVSIFKIMENSYQEMGKYLKLYQTVSRFIDNAAVMHAEISARPLPEFLQSRYDDISDSFRSSGGMPNLIAAAWLLADNAERFDTNYDFPGESVDQILNKDLYSFLKRFLRINRNVFAHVMKCDTGIPSFMFDTVQKILGGILDRIAEIGDLIDAKMEAAFGDQDSLSSMLAEGGVRDWQGSGRISPDFMKQMIGVIQKFYAMYDELTGRKSTEIYPGARKVHAALASLAQTPPTQPKVIMTASSSGSSLSQETQVVRRATDKNAIRLYDSSLQQIFEFAVWGGEQQKTFLKGLNDFKRLPDPMSSDDVSRKTRRAVARMYWDLYGAAFIRAKSVQNVPAPVRLMLQYGFLDETMVEPDQILALHENMEDRYQPSYLPVLYEHEFLSKIWGQEEPPSMTEMGQSYESYLREMSKTSSKKGPDPMLDLNDPVKQVQFEIANRIHQTSIVCSGSISTSFPILCSAMVKGSIDNMIMTRSKLESIMRELVDSDYSAFYRETVLKHGDAREVIEEEILPYIVILPIFGAKTMMWQELVGINKRSRGRIIVPALFMGDIVKSLAHSIAVFRWEILRTMKGGMWQDPVEGGLTGAYNDYVQFYKKNSKLSTEAKEKIGERLRSHRNNVRELFAEDYILWVRFEKNGIMKMNNVSRDLFYRYVPFRKDVREKLEKMPAFTESANRFKNIRKRTFEGFERKFRKYIDAQGKMPLEIEKYLNYLQM